MKNKFFEVGKFYKVPCRFSKQLEEYIPLTGIPHNDVEDNDIDVVHQHIDLRFCTLSLLRKLNPSVCWGDFNFDYTWTTFATRLDTDTISENIFYRKMECIRLLNQKNYFLPNDGMIKLEDKLEKENFNLNKNCKICPHRNTNLTTYQPVNGVITCPAHGLSFDSETGKLIRKTT